MTRLLMVGSRQRASDAAVLLRRCWVAAGPRQERQWTPLRRRMIWLLVLALGLVAGLVIGLAIALQSAQGKEIWSFIQVSQTEVRKVVWPTRKEAMQMTGYVFAFVFVMALFLWVTDKTLEWVLYDLVLGWKR